MTMPFHIPNVHEGLVGDAKDGYNLGARNLGTETSANFMLT